MTSSLTIRIDSDLKKEAEALFSDLGMSLTTAINVFFNQAIHSQGIPFTIKRPHIPNDETLAAMEEAKLIACDPSVPYYTNMEDLKKALDE